MLAACRDELRFLPRHLDLPHPLPPSHSISHTHTRPMCHNLITLKRITHTPPTTLNRKNCEPLNKYQMPVIAISRFYCTLTCERAPQLHFYETTRQTYFHRVHVYFRVFTETRKTDCHLKLSLHLLLLP